jgi:multidrug efflux pump subunit AcrA (membrane-fusion protein)
MFGNMRLATGGVHRALLVPDAAVQTDQARKTLLVVGKDGKVAAKPVELGPVVNGLRVIRSGIEPTDKVVISGTQMALPGMPVQPHDGRIAPDARDPAELPAAAPAAAEATFAR